VVNAMEVKKLTRNKVRLMHLTSGPMHTLQFSQLHTLDLPPPANGAQDGARRDTNKAGKSLLRMKGDVDGSLSCTRAQQFHSMPNFIASINLT